jgi:hypothetical protein
MFMSMSAPAAVTTDQPPLSIEEFREALPDKIKKSVNAGLINEINKTLSDPDLYESYRDNLLSYTSVMMDGKFKIHNYLEAIKYVCHKLRGLTNKRAYELTYPKKILDWNRKGVPQSDQSSYVSAYNKSKLVQMLMAQTMTPTWVLNQDMYQQALNTQADLMLNARSEMARTAAANSILTQLKPPEAKKIELEISAKEDDSINVLRQATLELAAQQRLAMQAGQSDALEVAESKIPFIDASFSEA